MKLYKYYSLNKNSLSCLVNKYVWYSSPNDFNDPYDTAIIDNDFLRSINFNNEKILCLSSEYNNFLMWAHYCDSHRGFCIEFTDYSDDELNQLKESGIFSKDAPNKKLAIVRNAKPIEYKTTDEINSFVKDFPTTEIDFINYFKDFKINGKEYELQELIHKSSYIKHSDWAYEKEYRLINTSNNVFTPPGKITGVYFGVRMPPLDKRCIGIILNPDLYGECKLYQMFREKGTYNLKARDFNPQNDLLDLKILY